MLINTYNFFFDEKYAESKRKLRVCESRLLMNTKCTEGAVMIKQKIVWPPIRADFLFTTKLLNELKKDNQ